MNNNFEEIYEEEIAEIIKKGKSPYLTEIAHELESKREFGKKKYGVDSFQLNYDNAMKVNIFQHIHLATSS